MPMRIKYVLVSMFLSSAAILCGDECGCAPISSFSRTYLSGDQICLREGKIYIQDKDEIFLSPAIYSDEKGFFIIRASKDSEDCKSDEWWCSKCRQCNKNYYFLCPTCSKANWHNQCLWLASES